MSQHYYTAKYNGQEVTVQLGWDRPLGHFFLVIMQNKVTHQPVGVEAGEGDDEESYRDPAVVYSNLDEPDGFDLPLSYYRAKLDELGITVPRQMFDQVELDAMNMVGNRVVWYADDGSFKEP